MRLMSLDRLREVRAEIEAQLLSVGPILGLLGNGARLQAALELCATRVNELIRERAEGMCM
jgi:hypothetical protein